jgi:rRNA-processing protein FCF1
MKYLFLDTNIYLHYQDIEQVDWASVVNDGNITIVVPRIVIREIDKHKDTNKGKIQKRAKRVSSIFAKVFLNNESLKLPLVECGDPNQSLFDGYKFNISINDDWIILSALYSGYDKKNIVIVSSDNNLLLKAKDNDLSFKKMPDEYLLKVELSEEEKEIAKLKAEVERYRNRLSKPSIRFINGESKIVFQKPMKRNLQDELAYYMEELKAENPYMYSKSADPYYDTYSQWRNIRASLQPYTAEQIEFYNKQLDDFYNESEAYQKYILERQVLDEQFKELSFEIVNEGTAQTGDMVIFLEFPEEINLYDKNSKIHKDDIQPIKPNITGLNRKLLRDLQTNEMLSPFTGSGIPQLYCWDVQKEIEEHEFKFMESKLNHGIRMNLNIENSLYVDTLTCGDFKINWFISDSELVEPVKGELVVTIE